MKKTVAECHPGDRLILYQYQLFQNNGNQQIEATLLYKEIFKSPNWFVLQTNWGKTKPFKYCDQVEQKE